MESLGARVVSFLIAVATALAVIAVVIPLFLNPAWIAFEQGRAQATTWTGYTVDELRVATDGILADLVLGPPDFDGEVAGAPVLNARERDHMRDVRAVFMGFFLVVLAVTVVGVLAAARRRGQPGGSAANWRAVRSGALGLIVGLVIVGGFAFIAFDVLFEIFHRLFFAGGTYTFDPASERLVQLFPFTFWQETAIAVGVAAVVVAAIVAIVAHRRLVAAGTVDGPLVAEAAR